MKDEILVKRYAEAFMSYAQEVTGLDRIMQDLRNLKHNILEENPEFLEFLSSSEITYAEKCAFVEQVMGEDFLLPTKHFLRLLLEKKRIDKLPDIIDFLKIKYLHPGQQEVLLKTSYFLDNQLIQEIENCLEKKFQQKLKFYIELDASLMGGIQVIIGNTVIDGSVKKRLEDLREKLNTIKV
ncbi:MAG: ATP synthase F1 subunit delta [Candidatus Omnitrophota bacterium]